MFRFCSAPSALIGLTGLLLAACEAPLDLAVRRAHPHDSGDPVDSADSDADPVDDTGPDDTGPDDTGPALSTDTGDGANPRGVDVSHWDEDIDWGRVAADDVRFAWIKATQGPDFEDPKFQENFDAAAAAGLYRGAYHFAEPNSSGGASQADYFVEHGGGWTADGQTLPGALDIEWNPYDGDDCYDLSTSEMTAWIHDFIDEYTLLTGRPPAVYCGQLWWSYCVDDSDFSAAPLWVASWDDPEPALPAGWTDWEVWQYGGDTVDGISVDSDVNVYNGSEARLAAFARVW